jgi:hypothetical protein
VIALHPRSTIVMRASTALSIEFNKVREQLRELDPENAAESVLLLAHYFIGHIIASTDEDIGSLGDALPVTLLDGDVVERIIRQHVEQLASITSHYEVTYGERVSDFAVGVYAEQIRWIGNLTVRMERHGTTEKKGDEA